MTIIDCRFGFLCDALNAKIPKRNFNLIIASFVFLYFLPIVISNIYFIDDYDRAIHHYAGWWGMGRPFAWFISHAFAHQVFFPDMFPLFILLSIFIVIASSIVFSIILNRELTVGYLAVICSSFASPFLLQNMLYRYDSFSMAVALLFSVFSVYFLKRKKIISIGLLFLSLSSYQPCANVFLALVVLKLTCDFVSHIQPKSILKDFFASLFIYVATCLIYQVTVNHFLNKTARGDFISLDMSGFDYFLGNMAESVKILLSFFAGLDSLIFIFIFCLFFVSVLFSAVKYCRSHVFSIYLIITLVIVFSSPFLLVLSGLGPISLVKGIEVHPRMLPAFCIVIPFFLIHTLNVFEYIKNKMAIVFVNALLWCITLSLLSFSYVATNVIKVQSDYERYLVSRVVTDISNLGDNLGKVVFLSRAPISNVVSDTYLAYGLINYISPPSDNWVLKRIAYFYGIKDIPLYTDDDLDGFYKIVCSEAGLPKIAENNDYIIYEAKNMNVNVVAWKYKHVCK